MSVRYQELTPLLLVSLVALGGELPQAPLMTRWAKELKRDAVLAEYPRPQLVRSNWLNLNGVWDYAITPKTTNGMETPVPAVFEGPILVPFALESALSGVMRPLSAFQALWYQRCVRIPEAWSGQRIWLRFGAVDWDCSVWVNGKPVGSHRGGFDAFGFDITAALTGAPEQEITIRVYDSESGDQPVGKQTSRPGGTSYTAVSGIWQTVWLEPVPAVHVARLALTPKLNPGSIQVEAEVDGDVRGVEMVVEVLSAGQKVGTETTRTWSFTTNVPPRICAVVPLRTPRLWSPEDPFLYDARVTLMRDGKVLDSVGTYFGMREVSLGKDAKGLPRIELNGQPVFLLGVLDEGFWPDGLYTPPSDEALRFDLETAKGLGFNTCRKHAKVESERGYYWCDKLGLLLWQDMPSGRLAADSDRPASAEKAAQFRTELERMVAGLQKHPCIIGWVLFNQGWGQHNTKALTRDVREWDPTRLIISASGSDNHWVGDVASIHVYPKPGKLSRQPGLALILGEVGGLGYPPAGHVWNQNAWSEYPVANSNAFLVEFERVMAAVADNRDSKGLNGSIFTQLSDVEEEVTGLMSFDREVMKVDTGEIRRINQTLLQKGPPEP